MDLLSLLGLILGAGFIVVSILLGEDPTTGAQTLLPEQLSGFWDLPSVMIVLGGTIASLMISFPLKSFAKIPKHLKIIFAPKRNDNFLLNLPFLFFCDIIDLLLKDYVHDYHIRLYKA